MLKPDSPPRRPRRLKSRASRTNPAPRTSSRAPSPSHEHVAARETTASPPLSTTAAPARNNPSPPARRLERPHQPRARPRSLTLHGRDALFDPSTSRRIRRRPNAAYADVAPQPTCSSPSTRIPSPLPTPVDGNSVSTSHTARLAPPEPCPRDQRPRGDAALDPTTTSPRATASPTRPAPRRPSRAPSRRRQRRQLYSRSIPRARVAHRNTHTDPSVIPDGELVARRRASPPRSRTLARPPAPPPDPPTAAPRAARSARRRPPGRRGAHSRARDDARATSRARDTRTRVTPSSSLDASPSAFGAPIRDAPRRAIDVVVRGRARGRRALRERAPAPRRTRRDL